MRLTDNDHRKILKRYNISIPKTKKGKIDKNKTRKLSYNILSEKLCKCIKKVQKSTRVPENSAIAICNDSIFAKKGLHHFRFTCKKNVKLLPKKNTKMRLAKTRRNIL